MLGRRQAWRWVSEWASSAPSLWSVGEKTVCPQGPSQDEECCLFPRLSVWAPGVAECQGVLQDRGQLAVVTRP